MLPKYTRAENERRWLVDATRVDELALPTWDALSDRYLDGCRLRLRRVVREPSGERVYKLTKKLASADPRTQPIVSIYLDEAEYEALAVLPAAMLAKRRFHHGRFAVDVFAGELAGLALCEVEADTLDALAAIEPPPFAAREVTADPFFTGGALCPAARTDVEARLGSLLRRR